MARNYANMDALMEVLPENAVRVQHCQGHCYNNSNLPNSMEEKEATLS